MALVLSKNTGEMLTASRCPITSGNDVATPATPIVTTLPLYCVKSTVDRTRWLSTMNWATTAPLTEVSNRIMCGWPSKGLMVEAHDADTESTVAPVVSNRSICHAELVMSSEICHDPLAMKLRVRVTRPDPDGVSPTTST